MVNAIKEKIDSYDKERLIPLTEKMISWATAMQAISFLSEAYGFGDFIYDWFGSIVLAVVIAIAIAYVIEMSVFELVVYIADSFTIDNYWKIQDRIGRGLLVGAIVLLIGASIVSIFLSKKNVGIAINNRDIEDKVNIDEIEESRRKELGNIVNLNANNYSDFKDVDKESRQLIKDEFAYKIQAQELEKEKWERKEKRSKLSYTTQKLNIDSKIASLKKDMSIKLQALSNKKLTKGEGLQEQYNKSTLLINQKYDKKILAATAKNEKNYKKKENNYWYFALFFESIAGLSVIAFICLRVFVQFALAKSEIRREVNTSPTAFQSGILKDLGKLSILWLTRKWHNKIRSKISEYEELIPIENNGAFMKTENEKPENHKIKKEHTIKKKEYKPSKTSGVFAPVTVLKPRLFGKKSKKERIMKHPLKQYTYEERNNLKGNIRSRKSRLAKFIEKGAAPEVIREQQDVIDAFEEQLERLLKSKVG